MLDACAASFPRAAIDNRLHDRKPTSFFVYLWLDAEQTRRDGPVQVSYVELAESVGVSKSSAQVAVNWLLRRKLLAVSKDSVTATPCYMWKENPRHSLE